MKTVAVVTAAYNRANLLRALYTSLRAQSSCDFVWYIVDDGSTDHTEDVVQTFDRSLFDIKYIKKTNGGRHTALNAGIAVANEKLVFPVDSDDWLDEHAIETIINDWQQYENEHSIAGLSYYKMLGNGTVISDSYPGDHYVGSFIQVRVNGHISGDSAEIFRTDVLREFPFPEFQEEKFLSEAIVWHAIAQKYDLVYIPKGIYYCEYREDGLSKNGRIKQLKAPKGTLLHAKAYLYKEIKTTIRLKYACMFVAIAILLEMRFAELIKISGSAVLVLICYIPGWALRLLWKKKYRI